MIFDYFPYEKICLRLALMHFNAALNEMLEILLQKICFAQALRVESWQNLIFFTHISVETIVATVVHIWEQFLQISCTFLPQCYLEWP